MLLVRWLSPGLRARRFFFRIIYEPSLPKPDLHLRVSEQAMTALRRITQAEHGDEYPVNSKAAAILEEAVLGKIHKLNVVARQMVRSGFVGIDWDDR